MCKYNIYVFLILLAWTEADPCLTPLGATSECVLIGDCSPLKSGLLQSQKSSDVTNFIRRSHCGFEGATPKVCCGPLPSNLHFNHGLISKSTAGSTELDPVDQYDSFSEHRQKCGQETNGNRIFGGNQTELDEFPWMALLVYEMHGGDPQYLCGGSLINHRYVLTAAHCLSIKLQQRLGILTSVRLGEYDIDKNIDCNDDECAHPPQEIPVHEFYSHPDYSEKHITDDIGLIRLSRRAHYNDFVKPICLVNKENSRYGVGIAVFIAGWGRTEHGPRSSKKLKLDLSIYNKTICALKYRQNYDLQLTEKQMCAGGVLNKDACAGDSGGPLMRLSEQNNWEVIGVGSFGYGCGLEGWPAVYTSVGSYVDWILDKMRETNVQ